MSVAGNGVRQVGKGQIVSGLGGTGKKFKFCSECCGKPLEDFDQGMTRHRFVLSKDCSDCCMENRQMRKEVAELGQIRREESDWVWEVMTEVLRSDWI